MSLKRGFTLIELTVAVLISGIAGTIALSVLVQARRQMTVSQQGAAVTYNAPLTQAKIKRVLQAPDLNCEQTIDSIQQLFSATKMFRTNCSITPYGRKILWEITTEYNGKMTMSHGVVFEWANADHKFR